MAAAALPAAGLDYVVQAGDTLSLISLRYGLDWEVVAQVNGITNTEVIEIGQVIRLPGVRRGGGFRDDGHDHRDGESTARGRNNSPCRAASGGTSYTVVAGDTLFGIALRANVTLQELAAANNMQEDDLLLIGQTLVIPGRGSAAAVAQRVGPAARRAPPSPAAHGTGTRRHHQDRRHRHGGRHDYPDHDLDRGGDGIAAAAVADTRARCIAAVTSTAGTTTATAGCRGPSVYTVAEGDTIITIALAHNLDWQELSHSTVCSRIP